MWRLILPLPCARTAGRINLTGFFGSLDKQTLLPDGLIIRDASEDDKIIELIHNKTHHLGISSDK